MHVSVLDRGAMLVGPIPFESKEPWLSQSMRALQNKAWGVDTHHEIMDILSEQDRIFFLRLIWDIDRELQTPPQH